MHMNCEKHSNTGIVKSSKEDLRLLVSILDDSLKNMHHTLWLISLLVLEVLFCHY